MSPGTTMMRVYATLKARIIAGEFNRGDRLDPARLAPELGSSRTPVRDALLRLRGERLVESAHNDGFRIPRITETSLRDLYGWSNEILQLALRTQPRRSTPSERTERTNEDYAEGVATCFLRISRLSPNHEHYVAISSATERLATIRPLEAKLLEHAFQDVLAIENALIVGNWTEAKRMVERFHRFRVAIVSRITSELEKGILDTDN